MENLKTWGQESGVREVQLYQIKSGGQYGCVRDGAGLAAVEQELEALHALPDGSQVHHIMVPHGLLAGR